MPRYYCDYCDTYLTHDSPSVRKQHNSGYKHKANVRTYYQQFEEQQTQSLIDQKVKEHLGQAGYPQVGAAFHQHLTAYGGQYRPPIPLPLPVRPLVLPRPPVPSSGYMAPPGVRPPTADANGFPRPQTLMPPGAPDARNFPQNNLVQPSPGAPSNGSYPSGSSASGAPTQYSAQPPFRPMAPSGQAPVSYGYGQQNTANGYSGTSMSAPRYSS